MNKARLRSPGSPPQTGTCSQHTQEKPAPILQSLGPPGGGQTDTAGRPEKLTRSQNVGPNKALPVLRGSYHHPVRHTHTAKGSVHKLGGPRELQVKTRMRYTPHSPEWLTSQRLTELSTAQAAEQRKLSDSAVAVPNGSALGKGLARSNCALRSRTQRN